MNNLLIDITNCRVYLEDLSKIQAVDPRPSVVVFLCPNYGYVCLLGRDDTGRIKYLREIVWGWLLVCLRVSRATSSLNWWSLSKIQGAIMPIHHPGCTLNVPFGDIVTCVKVTRTLVSISQYHLTRTTLPDGGEETLVAAIDKYSALAESLQALIDQHEEACNVL